MNTKRRKYIRASANPVWRTGIDRLFYFSSTRCIAYDDSRWKNLWKFIRNSVDYLSSKRVLKVRFEINNRIQSCQFRTHFLSILVGCWSPRSFSHFKWKFNRDQNSTYERFIIGDSLKNGRGAWRIRMNYRTIDRFALDFAFLLLTYFYFSGLFLLSIWKKGG